MSIKQSVYGDAVKDTGLNAKVLQQGVQEHFRQTFVGFNKNDFYKQYNERLTKQFEEMNQNKGFDIYQKGVIKYGGEYEGLNKLLVNSEHISPLLKALEDENSVLKKEIGYLSGDLKKFISMVELLLEENKYIREHINHKNRDIQNLIETIGMNDGEEIHDLKHKNHILTEENNILIKHLDEMKQFREDYDNFVFQNETDMGKAKQLYEKAQDDLEATQRREENLSKQLASLEPKYLNFKKKAAAQEDEIEQLKTMFNDKENQAQSIENQLNQLQRNFEDLNTKKGLENDQLLQENHLLQNEKKDLKSKLQLKEKQIMTLQDESKQGRRDQQQLSSEFNEIQSVVNEYQNQIQIEKSRAESSLQREKQMRERLDLALNETEKSTLKLQQLERQYNSLLDNSKFELQEKHTKYEEIISNLKNNNNQQVEEKEDELNLASKNINEQKRLIDRLQSDNESKTRDIEEFKSKLIDHQHQKRIIDAQNLELRAQQNEVSELNNLLNEYKANLQQQPDIRIEQDKLLRQIQDLEDKCKELELENQENQTRENYDLLEQKCANLQQKNDNLSQINEDLRTQISDVKRDMDQMLDAGVNTRLSKKDQEIKMNHIQTKYQNQLQQREREIENLREQISILKSQPQQSTHPVTQQPPNQQQYSSYFPSPSQQQQQQPQQSFQQQKPPQQQQQQQQSQHQAPPQYSGQKSMNTSQQQFQAPSADISQDQGRGQQIQGSQHRGLGYQQSPGQLRNSKQRIFDTTPQQQQQFNRQDWLK